MFNLLAITIFLLFLLLSFMYSPQMLVLLFVTSTLVFILLLALYLNSYWFSYLMFLVVIGGMMVVMIYTTMAVSDEESDYTFGSIILSFGFIGLAVMAILNPYFMFFSPSHSLEVLFHEESIFSLVSMEVSMSFVYIIFILLLILVSIGDMLKTGSGPLRMNFYVTVDMFDQS